MDQIFPWKLRVDTVDRSIIDHICTHYSPNRWVWCIEEEHSDNPHSHYYLEMTNKTKTALADYIKTIS